MVAVLVHEVVGIPLVLFPHLLYNTLHILLQEISTAQDY